MLLLPTDKTEWVSCLNSHRSIGLVESLVVPDLAAWVHFLMEGVLHHTRPVLWRALGLWVVILDQTLRRSR